MSVTVVVGTQWGDEGKGKIVDLLAGQMDYVARYQGGANAGHTIHFKERRFILHLIPSGILHRQPVCLIGNGVAVDPRALKEEIFLLKKEGIRIKNRLFISDRAHLIFSFHITLDQLSEESNTGKRIGTTGRGIGPAYVDKFNRCGLRVADLLNREELVIKLKVRLEQARIQYRQLAGVDDPSLNVDTLIPEYLKLREVVLPYVADTSLMLHQAIKEGKQILLEGAQGTLLDIDHGTYPFVTSSNPVSGGACTGTGIGPTAITNVLGVMKTYTTRVGEGPFPTELTGEEGDYFRQTGGEFGATTGRPRRCGWFDAVIARYAARVNGLTALALTKLDVLDNLDEIKICTAYEYRGKTYREFPPDIQVLQKCKPVYETFPGWKKATHRAASIDELPQNARRYIRRLEEITGVPAVIVSVGSRRQSTIHCRPFPV